VDLHFEEGARVQTGTKPPYVNAFASKVAVPLQPNRRLRASIKQSAKSAVESFLDTGLVFKRKVCGVQ
jgi:hypothetical protein